MSGPKEWKITVGQKATILAEFNVPMHQLDRNHLNAFLKAIVVRNKTEDARDMLPYYVNRRKGSVPRATDVPKIISDFNFEKRWNGYFCGDWECYARAVYSLSEEEAQAVKDIQDANRGGA